LQGFGSDVRAQLNLKAGCQGLGPAWAGSGLSGHGFWVQNCELGVIINIVAQFLRITIYLVVTITILTDYELQ
jgi:hypothetical protein